MSLTVPDPRARGFALASRSLKAADSSDSQLHIPTDCAKPDDILAAFAQTKEVWGAPSVVVYNASSVTWTPADDPLAPSVVSPAEFNRDLNINITSPFLAAQQAVAGFAQLAPPTARAFLYTGNITNVAVLPKFITQSIGKSGGAAMIWAAAEAYKDRGYKFYYVDERKPDGSAKYKVSGEAHAKHFWELAHGARQGPWYQTFVDGVGYQKFE
ncbi:hypothetical protein IAU59_006243 [Kwoniella sp. CBS 9459]